VDGLIIYLNLLKEGKDKMERYKIVMISIGLILIIGVFFFQFGVYTKIMCAKSTIIFNGEIIRESDCYPIKYTYGSPPLQITLGFIFIFLAFIPREKTIKQKEEMIKWKYKLI